MKRRMKKVLALMMVLSMGMSMTTFAAAEEEVLGTLEDPITLPKSSAQHPVTINVDSQDVADVYSVTINWDDLTFEYDFGTDDSWDPTTHTYQGADDAGWKDNKTNAAIKVTNHSNAPVAITGNFQNPEPDDAATSEENGVTATLGNREFDLLKGEINGYDSADNNTMTVGVSGTPTTFDGYTLDNIVVEVSAGN